MARRIQNRTDHPLLAVPPNETLFQHCAGILARGLMGEDVVRGHISPAEKELAELRKKCRKGNPFPLVAYQWPELVVSDDLEAKFFQGTIGNADDPCLRLDPWQRQIIAAFFDDTIAEIFTKGNTKAGKGTSTSIGINLWFDVWEQAKIILTSADYEHACKNIYGEVRMWRERMTAPGPGRMGAEGVTDLPEHYIVVRNPLKDEGFSGQHGPRTLFVFDEASAIREGLYENAQKQFRKIVALSNPRTLFGWFRNGFKKCDDQNKTQTIMGDFGRRLCVTVGGLDCLNVREKRLERPIAPPGGIDIDDRSFPAGEPIPPDYFSKVKPLIPNQVDYGRFMGISQHPDSRHVDIYAHGKFPTEDPQKQVILASWLEFHEAAWTKMKADGLPPAVEAFGLDVARSLDGDSTCLAAGGQNGLRGTHKWKYADITFHENEVLRIAREEYGVDLTKGRTPVCVDMDGLGAGLGDNLRRRNVWVIEFRGNAKSEVDPRIFVNLRAEAYGTLGRRLNPDDRWRGQAWALPQDEQLRQELCAPEKIYDADALRFKITPKYTSPDHEGRVVSIKDKLGRSPDTADAVVYLWHAVRLLWNLNDYFRQIEQPLVMYPSSESIVAGEIERQEKRKMNGDGDEKQNGNGENHNGNGHKEPEPDILRWLKQQYGGLVGRDQLPPEEVRQKMERFKKEQLAAARANAAAAIGNGNGNGSGHADTEPAKQESWLDRVKWSEGD